MDARSKWEDKTKGMEGCFFLCNLDDMVTRNGIIYENATIDIQKWKLSFITIFCLRMSSTEGTPKKSLVDFINWLGGRKWIVNYLWHSWLTQ